MTTAKSTNTTRRKAKVVRSQLQNRSE